MTRRFNIASQIKTRFGLFVAVVLGIVTQPTHAASFSEDANGFVFIEAENFDLNVTQNNGAWVFDNTPLDLDAFTGWGYVIGTSAGGTDTNTNPYLSCSVNFSNAGPFYIWIGGSDAGGKSVSVGLDGAVPSSAQNIGGPDGIFGARFGGQVRWSGTNNSGGGYVEKAYLAVPSVGTHNVNLFIRDAGLKVDWILLTTNLNYVPAPYPNPANLPAESAAPASALSVALTQPAAAKSFSTSNVVTLAAKAFTNAAPITKIEFFARLLPAGVNTKVGEALSLTYSIGWTNPAPGNYALTAKVTDANLNTFTSSVVNVTIFIPAAYQTPLRWTTNNFDSGLGSFSLLSQNQTGGFDFAWQTSSVPAGLTGVLGGTVVRSFSVVPYVAERLERKASLNEDLWFTGSLLFSNINANNDTFLGYFDAASSAHPRVGLKVREPTSSGGLWRFSVEPNGVKINSTLPSGVPATYELHWIPSGLGDGSGTLTGSVAGLSFIADYSTIPSPATFDAFGWLAPSQGNDDTNRNSLQYFDNLAYVVPASQRLNIVPLPGNKVLLIWGIPDFTLQSNAVGLTTTNWADVPDPVFQQGGNFYVTNSVGGSNRWFRLRYAP